MLLYRTPMRTKACALIGSLLISLQLSCGREVSAHPLKSRGRAANPVRSSSSHAFDRGRAQALAYSGTDRRGIPHYFNRPLSTEAREILRRAYGIVSPQYLYISDSTPDGLLKYDPKPKPCSDCYVNSYRIGFISIRRPEESWDDLQRRVRMLHRGAFARTTLVSSSSVSAMDPDVQGEVTQMLDAARRAGFRLQVVGTYRSPQQEALLMAEGGGRTHTLTSLHSYGRALDIRIGDGNVNNPSTRRSWIAFRRWVAAYHGHDFRILGAPDHSWDWPHVELPSDRIGFRSVDEAVVSGRACLARRSESGCEFPPHLAQAR
jgi:hypothetical protein